MPSSDPLKRRAQQQARRAGKLSKGALKKKKAKEKAERERLESEALEETNRALAAAGIEVPMAGGEAGGKPAPPAEKDYDNNPDDIAKRIKAIQNTTSSGGCWADREFWEAFQVLLRMVTCAQGPINRESKDGGEDHSEIQLALSPSSPLPSLSS